MAEMCLHRTRADQVAPVFEALVRLAPTPEAMVEHEEEALEAMRSLGPALARREHHRGRPRSRRGLRRPGTGQRAGAALPARRRGLRRPGRALLRLRPAGGAGRHQHGVASSAACTRATTHAAGSCDSTCTASPAATDPTPPSTTRCSTSGRWSAAPAPRAAASARSAATAPPARAPTPPPQLQLEAELRDRLDGTAPLIPSARRLMASLRDIGYDLPAAVADLVDNSIDADARNVGDRHRPPRRRLVGSGSPTTGSA